MQKEQEVLILGSVYSDRSHDSNSKESDFKKLKILRQKETEYTSEELKFLYKMHKQDEY